MPHVIAWEFRVRPQAEAEFVEKYGPEGVWARLFRRSDGYIRTELFRDVSDQRRFITLDYWKSEKEFNRFRAQHADEYERLDKELEGLTEEERPLGAFLIREQPGARG